MHKKKKTLKDSLLNSPFSIFTHPPGAMHSLQLLLYELDQCPHTVCISRNYFSLKLVMTLHLTTSRALVFGCYFSSLSLSISGFWSRVTLMNWKCNLECLLLISFLNKV